MPTLDRRSFLLAGGAALGTAALAACGSSGGSGPAGGSGQLRWQDHFSALQRFHADWAQQQSAEIGTSIVYTYNDVSRSTEALQLAKQSDQLPEVYSNVLGLPLAALVAGGWVGELGLSQEAVDSLPPGSFTEGITTLDGTVYGLPLFSYQQYAAAQWFNTEVVSAADLDPDDPPTTYDEYRAALRQIASSGQDGVSPMILALGGVARMGEQVNDLAQAAGFPGFEGLEFRTGEYRFEDDTYVDAIEFWKELNDSGYIFPGSGGLTVADARSRWGAGVAGYFPDGPWCAGGVRNVAAGFEEQIGVGPLLMPQPGTLVTYRGAPASQFFVAAGAADPESATALVQSMTSAAYQQGLASGMDQPPLDLSVVQDADVVAPYAQLAGWFAETVKRMPQPVVRNPAVSQVDANARPISPDLGDIVQGYLGGDVADLRGALTRLSAAHRDDRDRALAAAQAEGAEVSLDDYAFPDWAPGTDYAYAPAAGA